MKIEQPSKPTRSTVNRSCLIIGMMVCALLFWSGAGAAGDEKTDLALKNSRQVAAAGAFQTSWDSFKNYWGDDLYAICLAWPGREVLVRSLPAGKKLASCEIGEVQMPGAKEPLMFSRDAGGLKISLPETRPGDHAFVLRIAPSGAH